MLEIHNEKKPIDVHLKSMICHEFAFCVSEIFFFHSLDDVHITLCHVMSRHITSCQLLLFLLVFLALSIPKCVNYYVCPLGRTWPVRLVMNHLCLRCCELPNVLRVNYSFFPFLYGVQGWETIHFVLLSSTINSPFLSFRVWAVPGLW